MGFNCARDSDLTTWLNNHAHPFVRERLCNVWVLTHESNPEDVCGFFTLASHQILTKDVTKRDRTVSKENGNVVANMPALPTQLLGKFAIDVKYQGSGMSALLMHYVYEQFLESARASAAKFLVLETNRTALVRYYQEKHGFTRSPSEEPGQLVRMYKRAADIEKTYEQTRQSFTELT